MAVPDPGGEDTSFVPSLADAVCGTSVLLTTRDVSSAVVVVVSAIVWVKRLSKLVLPLPTPTAGTEPSSVPFRVGLASGSILEVVCNACKGSDGAVGPCRFFWIPVAIGELGITYRFRGSFARRSTLLRLKPSMMERGEEWSHKPMNRTSRYQ